MQAIELLWPLLLGGLITPVVSWLSLRIPTDFPVKPVIISAGLSIGIVYALSAFFSLGWDWTAIIAYALTSHTASQITHEISKPSMSAVPYGDPKLAGKQPKNDLED